jgi:tetratricopeptide (TPR) repeat protein
MILENAFKALDHAAFFGPSSIVCFDAVSLNISGDRLYEEGDIHGAISEFTHALMIDPGDVNIHNSLGVCYGMAGQTDKAIECFDHAKWLDPENAMAYYNKGLIHLIRGDAESALDEFLEAEKIDVNVFETMLQIGKLYLDRTELENARSYLEKAQKLNEDSAIIYRLLGDCYMDMNLADQAVEAYTAAIKKNPNDAHSLSVLGCLYIEEGRNEEIATVFCRQSVDISPDSGLFRYRLGKVYMKQDKIKEALEAFKQAAELGQDAQREISQAESLLMEKAS